MDVTEAVWTKLDVREFASKPVPVQVKLAVLEAARLTQSGTNSQHWRFILVQKTENLRTMAGDSLSGKWVAGADFAVIVCTDPTKGYHMIDAGRAVQDMQFTAWDHGVVSGVFTGIKQAEFKRDFGVPEGPQRHNRGGVRVSSEETPRQEEQEAAVRSGIPRKIWGQARRPQEITLSQTPRKVEEAFTRTAAVSATSVWREMRPLPSSCFVPLPLS